MIHIIFIELRYNQVNQEGGNSGKALVGAMIFIYNYKLRQS